MTSLVVVSGGLREPSSTRLLADRLRPPWSPICAQEGVDATVESVELRPLGHAIMDAMLTGFPGDALAGGHRAPA